MPSFSSLVRYIVGIPSALQSLFVTIPLFFSIKSSRISFFDIRPPTCCFYTTILQYLWYKSNIFFPHFIVITKSSLLFYDEERVTICCYIKRKEGLFMTKTCNHHFLVNQEKARNTSFARVKISHSMFRCPWNHGDGCCCLGRNGCTC